jgi:hypothetical protein
MYGSNASDERKLKERKMKRFGLEVIVLLAAAAVFAQTPAPKPAPTLANPLVLTPVEQSEEKVAGIQADNVNLRLNLIQEQAQRMTTQLRTQASQLATQQAALDARIITAHGQDPTKNKIDRTPNSPTYMTIVPITPTPAPAAK